MIKLKFEYRIAFAYLIIGGIWIKFSDKLLDAFIEDADFLTETQTFKGWFYVTVTALLFYLFLKKHLNKLRNTELELEKHKNNLQRLVEEKTKELDTAIEDLSATNEELNEKNGIINKQNFELKETLQQLKETQSQLFQAEKMASLGVLTAGIAHEINNPLNYILGGTTGLEDYFEGEKIHNERISLFIDSIKTGVDRASSIVSELNQLNSCKETYREDCEIHTIIENCLVLVNNPLEKKIKYFKEFADGELFVLGNIGQLHQALINILINANQSIENEGSIFISTEKKGGSVCIKIADTGCGIAKVNLSKITDPFFTTKEPGKGTGLGLSITYNIIQAHKGQISFQSEPNKGTTVTIELPINNHTNGEVQDTIC